MVLSLLPNCSVREFGWWFETAAGLRDSLARLAAQKAKLGYSARSPSLSPFDNQLPRGSSDTRHRRRSRDLLPLDAGRAGRGGTPVPGHRFRRK